MSTTAMQCLLISILLLILKVYFSSDDGFLRNQAAVEIVVGVKHASTDSQLADHMNNIPRHLITKSKLLTLNSDTGHIADHLCMNSLYHSIILAG